jgi:hypothetical protein
MVDATGAFVSGSPIICGGNSGYNYYSECYLHSKATNSWSFLTNMTSKRVDSASVSLKGKLFMMGGNDGVNDTASTEYVQDGKTAQAGPNLPTPLSAHCAVKLSNGKVILLGGGSEGKGVLIFDPEAETFDQSLPSMTHGRWYHACVVFKSSLHENREVVFALLGWNQNTTEVLDYTQPNSTWTESNYHMRAIIF